VAYALVHAGLGALLFLGLWATGRALARLARAPLRETLLPVAATLGLGMLAWSAGLFALGAAGALHPALLRAAAWGAGAAGAAWLAWSAVAGRVSAAGRARAEPPAREAPGPAPALEAVGIAAVIASLALLGLLALDPRVSWDAETYHLALPRLFLEERGLVRVPFFVYSTWPLATELLFAVALALRDHVLAHLLHFGCGALVVAGAARIARDAAGPAAGVLAAVLLLLDPSLRFEIRTAYVDLAFALFVLLAFAAWEPATECAEGEPSRGGAHAPRRRALLALAGAFLGAAAATKPNGLLGAAVFGALELARGIARRRPARGLAGDLACLALPALALAAPWYLRSAWLTGDPLHPALYAVFRGGGEEWSAELAARTAEHHRAYGMGRTPWDLLLLPLRLAAWDDPEAARRFAGRLHPVWAFLVPLVGWGAFSDRGVRRLVAPALLYVLGWAYVSQTVRLLMPAQPLLAAAAAISAVRAARAAAPRWPRLPAAAAAVAATGLLAGLGVGAAPRLAELRALSARGEAALLDSAVPAHCRFVNEHLPGDARILMLDENRTFFCRRAFLADSLFQASQLEAWLRAAPDEAALAALLHERRVTHVLAARRSWGIEWPAPLREALAAGRWLAPIYRDADYVLYELRPSAPSPARAARGRRP
jgi:hypothetical protein